MKMVAQRTQMPLKRKRNSAAPAHARREVKQKRDRGNVVTEVEKL